MMPRWWMAACLCALGCTGCLALELPGGGGSGSSSSGAAAEDDDDDGDDEPGGPSHAGVVPSTASALAAYLDARSYKDLPAEPGVHVSSGAHGADAIRVFFNPALVASLTGLAFEHPIGAAAVAELYDATGVEHIGWAVSVKVGSDSGAGDGWYWYEVLAFGETLELLADGRGEGGCVACHVGGADFVMTALQ